mmetsp:Transcript_27920/g.64432  ORF Transcript_27920/g.64432 Transcript_27920/m.64432 type:complete len:137 (+) Transcript_27920:68-478(+)
MGCSNTIPAQKEMRASQSFAVGPQIQTGKPTQPQKQEEPDSCHDDTAESIGSSMHMLPARRRFYKALAGKVLAPDLELTEAHMHKLDHFLLGVHSNPEHFRRKVACLRASDPRFQDSKDTMDACTLTGSSRVRMCL